MDELYSFLCLHQRRLQEIAKNTVPCEALSEAVEFGLLSNLDKEHAALRAQAHFGANVIPEFTLANLLQDFDKAEIYMRRWIKEYGTYLQSAIALDPSNEDATLKPAFNPLFAYTGQLAAVRKKEHESTSFVHRLELLGIADETLVSLRREEVFITPVFVASQKDAYDLLVGHVKYSRPGINRNIVEHTYIVAKEGRCILSSTGSFKLTYRTPEYPSSPTTLARFLCDA
jgi:hypothetical protein